MKNEFIPYEQALALKELGFDELCIALYRGDKLLPIGQTSFYFFNTFCNKIFRNSKIDITAPLYQRAFKWFREKCNLECYVKSLYELRENKGFYFGIDHYKNRDFYSKLYYSYEEAELECLKKLIKIVKNEKNSNSTTDS